MNWKNTHSSCSESFTFARSRNRSALMSCQVHSCRNTRIYNQLQYRRNDTWAKTSSSFHDVGFSSSPKGFAFGFLLIYCFLVNSSKLSRLQSTQIFCGCYVIARFDDNPCNNRNRAWEIKSGFLIPINSSSKTCRKQSVRYSLFTGKGKHKHTSTSKSSRPNISKNM